MPEPKYDRQQVYGISHAVARIEMALSIQFITLMSTVALMNNESMIRI